MDGPRSRHGFVAGRPHWWQWPTVLSLDAPAVAVGWQLALGRAAGVPLRMHHAFVLGASVWLAYAADRWIEGWRLDPAQVLTQRHWFYQEWRRAVALVWAGVFAAAVTTALTTLSSRELAAGFCLLGPVLLYLLSHQLVHRGHPWRAPKEVCVALLLAGGVACFPAARDVGAFSRMAFPLGLFTLLCFANCALISLWEHEVDRAHGQTSLALQFPRGGAVTRALPWLLAAAGASAALRPMPGPALLWCGAASGGLLGAVDLAHRRLGRQLSRSLADVALLTPWAPLAAAALRHP